MSPATGAQPGRLGRFELDLYLYGLRVGLTLLGARRLNRALRYLVQPVPYWRSLEYRLVWAAAGFQATDRVLDIGSPKLLSLYLADRVGAEVYSTDLEDYFVDEYTYLRQARRLAPERLHVETADGRALPYPDGWFSKVFSVSVIEHIPDHGDSECLREIARVLAPGGSCFITVPFSPTSREDYQKPDFYWARSSRPAGDGLVFFQRRYSEDDLRRRLIEPSGLEVTSQLYVGEKVFVDDQDRDFSDAFPITLMTSPAHPLIARLLHTEPSTSWRVLRKPLCAFLELRKPA